MTYEEILIQARDIMCVEVEEDEDITPLAAMLLLSQIITDDNEAKKQELADGEKT
jgi:hypothetical protein